MKWFKPGDIVEVKDHPSGCPTHPNEDRELRKGDRFMVDTVKQGMEGSHLADFDKIYVRKVGFRAWNGHAVWIDDKIIDLVPKGDPEDCLKFLERFHRKPQKMNTERWAWGELSKFGGYIRHFIPYYVFTHLPYKDAECAVIGGERYKYFKTEEAAFQEAANAWMLMTTAQQLFLNHVNYLEEI